MTKANESSYSPVNAAPVKSFFVHMLTRDIRLEDAILDLLDNCVDGVLRKKAGKVKDTDAQPYKGFGAQIEFKRDSFTITDNCGGIPWNLHDYAFRMGRIANRPLDAPGTVGVYGIGMKRAIFKMGRRCLIATQNAGDSYDVEIDPKWTDDEADWYIPVTKAKKKMPNDGTEIVIGDLHDGVSNRFSEDAEAFATDLERMIGAQYVPILDKGFSIRINGKAVKPKPIELIFDQKRANDSRDLIQPYIFRTDMGGVEYFFSSCS